MDKVIFRKFKDDGSIIALFPRIAVDALGYKCQSYMHVGQHGAAMPNIIDITVLAAPTEYNSLFKELEQIGYNPKPIKRFRYADQEYRASQYK